MTAQICQNCRHELHGDMHIQHRCFDVGEMVFPSQTDEGEELILPVLFKECWCGCEKPEPKGEEVNV